MIAQDGVRKVRGSAEKSAEPESDSNTPRAPTARSGSQLPTAIYPHQAAEKRRTRSGVFLRVVCGCLAEAGAVKEKFLNIKKTSKRKIIEKWSRRGAKGTNK